MRVVPNEGFIAKKHATAKGLEECKYEMFLKSCIKSLKGLYLKCAFEIEFYGCLVSPQKHTAN